MPVPQHVLNWLYSVLTSEYHDVNRTYNDVAHALARYSSLAPRTDVHTFPNGSSALLLHLSGTLPVTFRGSPYRFPISVWVPHVYPREPPIIYVTPNETMAIRPGQHVDPQGQVYHPYLVGWKEYWDKSTIFDFLTILSDIFAKEPPVISRQQPQAAPRPSTGLSSPGPPPAPPPPGTSRFSNGQNEQRPPPPPPKAPQNDARSQAIPSLFPIPQQSQSSPQPLKPSRYDSAPPLPTRIQSSGSRSNPSSGSSVQNRYHDPGQQGQELTYSSHQGNADIQYNRTHYGMAQDRGPPGHFGYDTRQGVGFPGQLPSFSQPISPQVPQARQAPQSPPDLLDEPLTVNIPSRKAIDPPPIPPNPEKDALLHQLAQTLASMRQHSRQQNESSLAGLQAQRTAMLSVLPTFQSEMAQLTQLSSILQSNSEIVHEALHRADDVIEGSASHPAPDVDELLVAPTVVSNQLYALVAEERAIGDAIFMLGKAVERGRISPTVFAKMTRSLAREWYLKKALVHKIGGGMGLARQ